MINQKKSHLGCAESKIYGHLLITIKAIKDRALATHSICPIPDFGELFQKLVVGCFFTQEAVATYDELVRCKLVFPEAEEAFFAELPRDYLEALRILEEAFGNIEARAEYNNVHGAMKTCLARCALDSPLLERFADFQQVTLNSIDEYLREDAPDGRFISLCNTIKEADAGKELVRLWSDTSREVAIELGISTQEIDGFWVCETADPVKFDAVNMWTQVRFLKTIGGRGLIKFPWLSEPNERQRVIDKLFNGWRSYLGLIGKQNLYPWHETYHSGPMDGHAATPRKHLVRRHMTCPDCSFKPPCEMEDVIAVAREQLKRANLPIVSIEKTAYGTIVCLVLEHHVVEVDGKEWYEPLGAPVVVGTTTIENLRSYMMRKLRLPGDYTILEKNILWHYPAELLKEKGAESILFGPRGRFMISYTTYFFQAIQNQVEKFLEQGNSVVMRLIKGNQDQHLIIHPWGTRIFLCWPCITSDFTTLHQKFDHRENVICGRKQCDTMLGPMKDLPEMCALISVAYR